MDKVSNTSIFFETATTRQALIAPSTIAEPVLHLPRSAEEPSASECSSPLVGKSLQYKEAGDSFHAIQRRSSIERICSFQNFSLCFGLLRL